MKITFIDHSGFLIELKQSVLLFDYYKGEIPDVPGKKWYVFVSHFHEDHFQSSIFQLREKYDDITFIISKDVCKYRKNLLKKPYEVVTWNQSYQIGELAVDTFKSTDEGCAYFVHVEGYDIYHAGDLHWWHWIGEPDADNEAMRIGYTSQIDRLMDEKMDVAFMLLDPRQEEAYDWGMNYFMEHTKAKIVFPMHMWGQYDWCDKYLCSEKGQNYYKRFQKITREGETFHL
ncbi:MAG: MBL fold metallo-hydrolase [Lachnospiraceae bacterium]|nr:MBL fold metallo-hydrolase [Lachnospiraceae bacterium]